MNNKRTKTTQNFPTAQYNIKTQQYIVVPCATNKRYTAQHGTGYKGTILHCTIQYNAHLADTKSLDKNTRMDKIATIIYLSNNVLAALSRKTL